MPPMIVAPERDVPGMSEKHCAMPDLERVLPRHLVHAGHARRAVALVPALDREDHERAHDERDGHAHRVEEVGLDLRLEGEAHDRGGQEGHEEVHREALLHRIAGEAREGLGEARAIFPAHREDRAQLDHDVEDLALLVVQAEPVGDDDQVPGRGDGQELGEALAATSSFFIVISAFMTRCDFCGSGSLSNSDNTVGTICHDRPNLSLSQPHCTFPVASGGQLFPVGIDFGLRDGQ